MKECRKHKNQKNKVTKKLNPKTQKTVTLSAEPATSEKEPDKLDLLLFATEYRELAKGIGVCSDVRIRCGRAFVKEIALEEMRRSFDELFTNYEKVGVRVDTIK